MTPAGVHLLLLFLWIALAVIYWIRRRRDRSRLNPYFLLVMLLLTLARVVESNRPAATAAFVSAFCALGAMIAALVAQKRRPTPS